jgi:hypothetical protein
VKATILFGDGDVVDAGFTPAHQAVLVELPLLVAVRAVPLTGIVVPFVLKANRDAVALERPEILDQAIIEFLRPFALEKRHDRGAALKKFGAIAPAAVLSVGERDTLGVA